MDRAKLATAFNTWMEMYTNTPEQFAREFETVRQFDADKSAGVEPTYGDNAAAFLLKLLDLQ